MIFIKAVLFLFLLFFAFILMVLGCILEESKIGKNDKMLKFASISILICFVIFGGIGFVLVFI